MDISIEAWNEIVRILKKHKVPYSSRWEKDDKHIQINIVIPDYYKTDESI